MQVDDVAGNIWQALPFAQERIAVLPPGRRQNNWDSTQLYHRIANRWAVECRIGQRRHMAGPDTRSQTVRSKCISVPVSKGMSGKAREEDAQSVYGLTGARADPASPGSPRGSPPRVSTRDTADGLRAARGVSRTRDPASAPRQDRPPWMCFHCRRGAAARPADRAAGAADPWRLRL